MFKSTHGKSKKLLDSRPKELIHVEELIYEAKFDEVLEKIEKFEKKGNISTEDKLYLLIIKGWIYSYQAMYGNAIKFGERAYQISQKLKSLPESIDALLLKATMVFKGQIDKSLEITLEAESVLNSLHEMSETEYSRRKAGILFFKSQINFSKVNYHQALEQALQCLTLREKIGDKFTITHSLIQIANICLLKGEINTGLEHALKNLKIQEEMGWSKGIAYGLYLVGFAHNYKGNLDLAIEYCKRSLLIKEITPDVKVQNYYTLGAIHTFKGELHKALKYHEKAASLAYEIGNINSYAINHQAFRRRIKGYLARYNSQIWKKVEKI